MPLQVAEGAVVDHDLEAIRRALESTARLVTAVGAVADVRSQQSFAIRGRQVPRRLEQSCVFERSVLVHRGGEYLRFALGVEIR